LIANIFIEDIYRYRYIYINIVFIIIIVNYNYISNLIIPMKKNNTVNSSSSPGLEVVKFNISRLLNGSA